MLRPRPERLAAWLRQLVFARDARKRSVPRALLKHGTRIAARSLLRALAHPGDPQPALYSRRPPWYDQ